MPTTTQATTPKQFDQAYWASQPPEVQALPGMADPDQRATQAATLATNGFTIDVPIMVWGWDPYLVMTMRAQFGYTWVPSALQPPVTIAPGLSQPGVVRRTIHRIRHQAPSPCPPTSPTIRPSSSAAAHAADAGPRQIR